MELAIIRSGHSEPTETNVCLGSHSQSCVAWRAVPTWPWGLEQSPLCRVIGKLVTRMQWKAQANGLEGKGLPGPWLWGFFSAGSDSLGCCRQMCTLHFQQLHAAWASDGQAVPSPSSRPWPFSLLPHASFFSVLVLCGRGHPSTPGYISQLTQRADPEVQGFFNLLTSTGPLTLSPLFPCYRQLDSS